MTSHSGVPCKRTVDSEIFTGVIFLEMPIDKMSHLLINKLLQATTALGLHFT